MHYQMQQGKKINLTRCLQSGDTFTMYHGFRDMEHAVRAVRQGLTGRQRISRTYSYENNNNPYGLFVTLDFKKATEFGQTVIEFIARLEELEAPVWPGNSYTVQGQMAQYFDNDLRANRANRRARRQELNREIADKNNIDPMIQQSSQSWRDYLLIDSYENQSLFVGHLDPKRITRVWHNPHRTINLKDYQEMTPKEFLDYAGDIETNHDQDHRIFTPEEPWDPNKFQKEWDMYSRENIEILWGMHLSAQEAGRVHNSEMVRYLLQIMWPRQLPYAIRWIQRQVANKQK